MARKFEETINKRLSDDKKRLVNHLKQVPIIQVACQKSGIGRSSYYRWCKEDKQFAKKADKALRDGKQLINELAESQLINAIKDQNMTGIIYWLRNNHPGYADRIELTHKTDKEHLSPEQEKLVSKALRLASLASGQKKGDKS